jgi:hypothetical protein
MTWPRRTTTSYCSDGPHPDTASSAKPIIQYGIALIMVGIPFTDCFDKEWITLCCSGFGLPTLALARTLLSEANPTLFVFIQGPREADADIPLNRTLFPTL